MKTYRLDMYRDDMGSYTTNFHDWDDALWSINSARDHDGLPHIDHNDLTKIMRDKRTKVREVFAPTWK